MQHYFELLHTNRNVILPFTNRNLEHATPHIMSIMLKDNYLETRNILREHRIQTSKHYDLIPTFSAFAGTKFYSKIAHVDNLLTLPLHPLMSLDDVGYICSVLNGIK